MSSPRRFEASSTIPSVPPVVFYPASLAQRRLWFLSQLQGSTAAYNVPVGLWLYGQLDVAALQRSLQTIVDRHEALRTSFVLLKGDLFQVVRNQLIITVPITDFSHLPEPQNAAYEFATRQVETPFDLSAGPLFRADVLRLAAEEHVLLCTMHHTITDAWSMQLFTNEMATLYEANLNGRVATVPELPIQYGDFSAWQIQSLELQDAQQHLTYWQEQLKDAPPLLELPRD